MTDLLDDFKEQIEDIFEEVRNGLLSELPKITSGTERIERCRYFKQRLQRVGVIRRSMLHEINDLSSKLEASKWQQIIDNFEVQQTSLQQQLLDAEAETPTISKNTVITSKDMTTAAKNIQQESKESAARTKQVVDNIIMIGTEVGIDLQMQTEQLTNIEGNAELIESNLKRADVQLRIILRNLQKDKLFLSLFFLMIVAIISAVIVIFVLSKTNDKSFLKEGESII
ncbi:hypothetical protein BCR32DRAFT_267877 [Anaeromyces robustus]|uniref:t-SNARE coiled-coil homology domain-containing protein n=1 Tax=Anaeromyces robustus TaxID=1754192 RepID=A0A1Y1X8M1_9FUNG|nr:hypothetical protein BCR32DRAFT_267877 [Anaeromyces robustus]|eukprot:ORX82111.1 hypothetical protein BCR32DRAFT_267877 [Anaeromyces robustus]